MRNRQSGGRSRGLTSSRAVMLIALVALLCMVFLMMLSSTSPEVMDKPVMPRVVIPGSLKNPDADDNNNVQQGGNSNNANENGGAQASGSVGGGGGGSVGGGGGGGSASVSMPGKKSSVGGADVNKQAAVREAFQHAWNGYRAHAWGRDDLQPVSNTSKDWLGVGSTIIDSLDTMWIMGLEKEFTEARNWVANTLDLNKRGMISVFEMTIRNLGGLLAAFDLSQDKVFLDKARDLADRLMPAFKTGAGIPYAQLDLVSGRGSNPSWTGGSSILSEIGTLQLEFKYLARVTGDRRYHDAVDRVMDVLDKQTKSDGLYPIYVNPNSGAFTSRHVTLGALGDSFYEYLIKQWVQTGKTEDKFRRMYDECIDGITKVLIKKSTPSQLTYIAEYNGAKPVDKMDHLACFAGGMYALGAQDEVGARKEEHMAIAAGITETCFQMYDRMKTGIAPEMVYFQQGKDLVSGASHYLLRPETVESFFYMWRYTHDQKYRDWGWKVFTAINKYCRVPGGFSGIKDVNSIPVRYDDYQHSFFLAETLKYLYLLFSDDSLIPLDDYVFNTEAHVLSVFKQ